MTNREYEMNYSEALDFKKQNAHLIGTTTDRGIKIGKLIIVPENEHDRNKFFYSFLRSNDEDVAILPYVNSPVEVWAVDIEYLNRNNVLFYKKLI